jgi:TolB-like protein
MIKKNQFIILTFIIFLLVFHIMGFSAEQIKVAVLYFKDSSINTNFSNFVDGIPDMLMTDLGKSDKIEIVERVQLDEAIKNFNLEKLKIFDQNTAVKIGKWVGANAVILGNFSAINEQVRMDARVIDMNTGKLLESTKVTGKTSDLFNLVSSLAENILKIVSGENKAFKTPDKVVFEKIHTFRFPDISSIDPYYKGEVYALDFSDKFYPDKKFRIRNTMGASLQFGTRGGGTLYNVGYVAFIFENRHLNKKKVFCSIDQDGKTWIGEITLGKYKIFSKFMDYYIEKRYIENTNTKTIKMVKLKIKIERVE